MVAARGSFWYPLRRIILAATRSSTSSLPSGLVGGSNDRRAENCIYAAFLALARAVYLFFAAISMKALFLREEAQETVLFLAERVDFCDMI